MDKNQTLMYMESAKFAKAHNELPEYRASHWANIACKEDIQDAIVRHFDGMRLNKEAVREVLDAYGKERTQMVLAATVQVKSWDGRFSRENKAWATNIPMPDCSMDHLYEYAVSSHPAVLDGFISATRRELAERDKAALNTTQEQPSRPTDEKLNEPDELDSATDMLDKRENEQNYSVLLTENQEVQLVYCGDDADTFGIARKAIGCEMIEVVEMNNPTEQNLVLLIDEEGKLKHNHVNCIASHLYGAEEHGDLIVGSAIFAKVNEDRLNLLTEAEARQVAKSMLRQRDQSIESIATAFGLRREPYKEQKVTHEEQTVADKEKPHRQPCKKKEPER